MNHIPWGLTYDDVLIVPRRSTLTSRSQADTKTRLTKKMNLNIPIVGANMDTVTESRMAIALARLGGIGIIHRFMTIEDNAEEIKRVKRAQNFIIKKPYTINQKSSIADAADFASRSGVGGLLVVDDTNRLTGILSSRDFLFVNGKTTVEEIMTPRAKLIIGGPETNYEDAKKMMAEHKIEKLPLVDSEDKICGIITVADIKIRAEYPSANIDADGQLIVGGAIGVHGDYLERAVELVKAGANVLVIDIAHGHSDMMFNAISKVRDRLPNVELIAGNLATSEGARELCEAGVDAIKVGVGPGTTCITRLVTGCGVPQLTAVMECSEIAKNYGVPVNADGGVQKSGDIVKAIGAGADTVMLGGLLAGTEESPGVVMNRGGMKYKVCRGSASFAVAQRRRTVNQEKKDLGDVVPEGIESVVNYKGTVEDIIKQMIGGLKSGMSYTNSRSISELQNNVEFVRITPAGQKESGPHDLHDIK